MTAARDLQLHLAIMMKPSPLTGARLQELLGGLHADVGVVVFEAVEEDADAHVHAPGDHLLQRLAQEGRTHHELAQFGAIDLQRLRHHAHVAARFEQHGADGFGIVGHGFHLIATIITEKPVAITTRDETEMSASQKRRATRAAETDESVQLVKVANLTARTSLGATWPPCRRRRRWSGVGATRDR